MRTLIAVALMVVFLTTQGCAPSADPKASAPASPQAFFQEQMALALKGFSIAQQTVGYSYENGLYGQAIDKKEAAKWYRLAAEQGNQYAQFNLALLYKNGEGVTQDYKEAVKWYRLAAEQGNAGAQNNLGHAYFNGRGLTQDYKEAVKWFRLAAVQANADAQASLGAMYGNGQGVLQDLVYAHMWANIGASNGAQNAAKNRDLNASKMTPSQLEKAQDLARACVKKNYKGC